MKKTLAGRSLPSLKARINVDWMKLISTLTILMIGSMLHAMDVNPSVQQRLDMKLRYTARTGNMQKVEKLINQGADVNEQNKSGETALMSAAEDGQRDVCELLIAKGANVNAQNNSGETALMKAAYSGHRKVCELLIAKGADVNAQNYKTGDTALISAAIVGRKKVCLFLIAHGANLYVQNKRGDSALVIAAYSNEEEVCKLLINEMIKQEQRQARTVLYPILKEHIRTGRDTARMVTQQLQQSQKVNKANYKSKVHEEIMKIKRAGLRKELLDYLNSL